MHDIILWKAYSKIRNHVCKFVIVRFAEVVQFFWFFFTSYRSWQRYANKSKSVESQLNCINRISLDYVYQTGEEEERWIPNIDNSLIIEADV